MTNIACMYQKNQIISVCSSHLPTLMNRSLTSSDTRLIIRRRDVLPLITSNQGMTLSVPFGQITEIAAEEVIISLPVLIDQNRRLNSVSTRNRIRRLTIAGDCSSPDIRLLISLCRHLQSLRCRVLDKSQLGLILTYLLTKHKKYHYHLLSISYSSVNAELIDRIRRWITRQDVFDDYSLAFSSDEFQIC